MNELVTYEGHKGKKSGSGVRKCEKLETGDMTLILDMAIEVSNSRMGRPAEYPNSRQGLEAFIQKTIDFFEYINGINENPDLDRKLIPDIENWAMYMGVTRQTIWKYEQRGNEWGACIAYYKNVIAAIKKQLALNYKIPPMVYVFDAVNNHGYLNSNEFKLTVQDTTQASDTSIEHQLDQAGLVWNEQTKEYEPI